MSTHLNEFNTIFSQLTLQEVIFGDSIKAMFILITLPNSWETFRIALGNLASLNGLTCAIVEGNLLIEEVNRKSTHKGKGEALVVRGRWPKVKKGKRVQSTSKSCSGHDKPSNVT